MKMRTKIFLPFSGLMLATLLSTLWLINSAVSHQVENDLRRQLVVTGEMFRGLVSERVRRLTADTVLLAADFALKRAIATYDPETLATVAVNYRERMDLDLLWITDESGTLLGDASGRQRTGRTIGNLPPLHEAIIHAHQAAALNELDGTLFVFVAVPVLAPDPVGFLLAGSAIDDGAARALGTQIGSAVTFVTANRLFASSWPAAERAAFFAGGRLGAEALHHGDTSPFLVQRGDEHLLSLLVPIESSLRTPLFALMQQSYDRARQPLHALRRRVVLIGATALAAALMLGALLAGGIAAPLRSAGDDIAPAPTHGRCSLPAIDAPTTGNLSAQHMPPACPSRRCPASRALSPRVSR
jgi:adenylate cyclase